MFFMDVDISFIFSPCRLDNRFGGCPIEYWSLLRSVACPLIFFSLAYCGVGEFYFLFIVSTHPQLRTMTPVIN